MRNSTISLTDFGSVFADPTLLTTENA